MEFRWLQIINDCWVRDIRITLNHIILVSVSHNFSSLQPLAPFASSFCENDHQASTRKHDRHLPFAGNNHCGLRRCWDSSSHHSKAYTKANESPHSKANESAHSKANESAHSKADKLRLDVRREHRLLFPQCAVRICMSSNDVV